MASESFFFGFLCFLGVIFLLICCWSFLCYNHETHAFVKSIHCIYSVCLTVLCFKDISSPFVAMIVCQQLFMQP